MNVLFVASIYLHLSKFHVPYMEYLQRKGYKVYAACAKDDRAKKELTDKGFICLDIHINRSPFSFGNFETYLQLKSLFIKQDFEIVHVHTPVAALVTRMAFRHSKKGVILYTAHGFHFYKGAPLINWLTYYPIERIATRWTDHVITMNKEDYKRALKMGFKKNAVHFVHGVGVETSNNTEEIDSSEYETLKKKLGISINAVVISYVAEINKNKNHEFLLRNWKMIKEKSPQATLLIIGDGNLRLNVERLIREEQLTDVKVLGFRNDVNDLLRITDIVSLLSYREGLPKSIMEAMASSIPCVVANTRGLRDLITHGHSGFIVPHGDDTALVEAFVTLLNQTDKRISMGTAALRDVEPYRLKNVLEEYIRIYDDVLG